MKSMTILTKVKNNAEYFFCVRIKFGDYSLVKIINRKTNM